MGGEWSLRQAFRASGAGTEARLGWLDLSLTLWPLDQERRRICADAYWQSASPVRAVQAIDWALKHDPLAVDLLKMGIAGHDWIGDRTGAMKLLARLRKVLRA